MKIPKALLGITSELSEANIDYRIGGGQAAVFYGLRKNAGDWDIAVQEFVPEIREILTKYGFTEIPDSEGLSWEGPILIDFIIADGVSYPTLEELGVKQTTFGLKFPKRSMMGYINWKDGESAYQHLKEYKTAIEEEVPEEVLDYMKHEPFEHAITGSSDFNNSKRSKVSENAGVRLMLGNSTKKLLALASKLDDEERVIEAALLDHLVEEERLVTAEFEHIAPALDSEENTDWASAAREHRKSSLIDEIVFKATGVPSATIRFYRTIEPAIKQFNRLLEEVSQYDRNSEVYINRVRSIQEKYNSTYDPYNTDHVPTKIKFISELLRVVDIVEANIDKAMKPELSKEEVVEMVVKKLRDQGLLKELTALKKVLS